MDCGDLGLLSTVLPSVDFSFLTGGLDDITSTLAGWGTEVSGALANLFGFDLTGLLGIDAIGQLMLSIPNILLGALVG
ncbi:hypothetical protein MKOR_26580 [Mycolicibacillus koreensis]|nr:hypothetical protein MKOR_26580 [Mycolicibacillus koreensis]